MQAAAEKVLERCEMGRHDTDIEVLECWKHRTDLDAALESYETRKIGNLAGAGVNGPMTDAQRVLHKAR